MKFRPTSGGLESRVWRAGGGIVCGFTLIEMLVALAVFSLLVTMLAIMASSVLSTLRYSQQQSSNSAKARACLDLLCNDLQQGYFNSNLPAPVVVSSPFSVTFYTRRQAVGAANTGRDLSLVSYSIQMGNGPSGTIQPYVQRSDLAVDWNDVADFPLGNPTASLSSPSHPIELFPGIIRLAIYFRDASGAYQTQFTTAPQRSVIAYVALVSIDDTSLRQLTTGQVTHLASAFPAAQPQAPAWEQLINNGTFFQGYPSTMRTGLSIYERGVPLP